MKAPELSYYNIANGIISFSTTRHGGCSRGNYGEFNINEYCGDEAEAIKENRKALAAELGIDADHMIIPHQTHGIETRQIAEDFLSLPENIRKMILEGVDAVMTNIKGVCVGVSTADCIPILLYDPEHEAVCAVHAGWRGTVARIVMKAVTEMRLAYQTKPSDLKAVIGPGISLDAFEVGNEVYEEFANANFEMDAISKQMKVAGTDFEYKWHIDLKECNRRQLLQCGINEENIQVSDVCTYNNVEDFFSARRLGTASGRIYSGIIIR